jgi:hypothetical protein
MGEGPREGMCPPLKECSFPPARCAHVGVLHANATITNPIAVLILSAFLAIKSRRIDSTDRNEQSECQCWMRGLRVVSAVGTDQKCKVSRFCASRATRSQRSPAECDVAEFIREEQRRGV